MNRGRIRSTAAVMLWALAAPAAAQEATFFHPVPPAAGVVTTRSVAYAKSDGKDVVMDVYRPASAAASARLPALIFLNTRADRSQREHPIYRGWAAAATAHGLVAIHPDAAADFAAGLDALLAYLGAHAAELRVDPERVAVYAASGNVGPALPAVQDPKRTGIHAAVMYYGFSQDVAFRADLPLLFVRAGLDRPAVNEAIDGHVAAALRANAPVQVLNYPGGHHAFEMIDDTDATRDAIDHTLRFVTAALSPGSQAALRAGRAEARAAGAMSSGDFATAVSVYSELVARRPDDPRLRLSYGEALLGARRYKDARAEFDRLKDAGLGHRDLGLPAARAAVADGDATGAVAWLKTIPKRFLPPSVGDDPAFAPLRGRADFEDLFR